MTDAARPIRNPRSVASILASSHVVLWLAFALVQVWGVGLNLGAASYGFSDVTNIYRHWVEQSVFAGYTVGIDGVFVYPLLAFVPMVASAMFGFASFGVVWLVMVVLLNTVALAFVTGWGRRHAPLAAGWWWTLFLLLLGPISFARIDAITVPFGLVAVVLIARRPRVAAVLLTIGAWMKIWPAALVGAMLIARRDRYSILGTAAGVSVIIVVIALAFGSGLNVFSFITQQTGRGLQIEAPVTTFWMWQAFLGVPGASVYYDMDILTYQVTGQGVALASSLMTPLLVVVVGLVCALGGIAVRRGASAATLLGPLFLALVVALIAVNKVGSPQFISWLAVPIVFGLLARPLGGGISFRVPAALVLALALLTQFIYPYFYSQLVALDPGMLLILTMRNLLMLVLLGWSITALARLARRPVAPGQNLPSPPRTAQQDVPTAALGTDGALAIPAKME